MTLNTDLDLQQSVSYIKSHTQTPKRASYLFFYEKYLLCIMSNVLEEQYNLNIMMPCWDYSSISPSPDIYSR